jgi:excisionase family DNA binding protein
MNNQILLNGLSIDDFRSIVNETVSSAIANFRPLETTQEPDQLIKIDEVCKILNVSKVTVFAWKKAGLIPFYRISNKIYFKRSEVFEALKKINKRGI